MPSFQMRWNSPSVWATYPSVGPHRAGQYQGYGGAVSIVDSARATVYMYHRGDSLYFGFDVPDGVVQYHTDPERWDGFRVNIIDRAAISPDSTLQGRRLTFRIGPAGQVLREEFLPFLIDSLGGGRVGLALKPGTSVDTLGAQVDPGYTAELLVDLTKLGYPAGLGDRSLFVGITHFDGDSFGSATSFSYGTRIWWFNEYDNTCCPVWAYLDPAIFATDVGDPSVPPVAGQVLGSWPNPFTDETNIRFALTRPSDVMLEVYDVQGRLVAKSPLGVQPAGIGYAPFDARGQAAGVYFYRMTLSDEATGKAQGTLYGKMTLVR
jgi:hypothetical protein